MVFHATHDDGLAFEIGQYATEVTVQFVAQWFVAEEGSPVFGGEDRMEENFGEGLRHDGMMRETGRRFNHIERNGNDINPEGVDLSRLGSGERIW